MAETIKGGAYQAPDGSWHDASGKPLSSKQVQEAQTLQDEQAAVPVSTETPPAPPAEGIDETAARRSRSKKS